MQDSQKTRSMSMALSSNYQYGNEFTDAYLYQDWFKDGYKYLEGHHSRDYNKNGFLFKRNGQVKTYEGKKFSFSYGTAFGVVLGAIAAVASGGTAVAVLQGIGISAGGVLIDYLTIKVWLEDDTFLYRVRDSNGKVLLDTHHVQRYVLGYNHNTKVSTKKFYKMAGGFAGTTSDMIEAGLSLH
ncbi:hypothetical protein [Clostridium sp. UBA5119]|uniref:hypothetical protein n=1 Tax=Clostridium sp. UBA5119 TaxID=1946366 RepID=UPI003217C544